MNISKFLAPRMSNKSILLLLFAYLALITVLMIGTTAASGIGVDPKTVLAAAHAEVEVMPTVDFQTPTIHIPAPPYIIVEPVN
ncbi:MAG: hypothetical protein IIA92_01170 [Chloroflexi bacterium]|nr:hypothetical protein [Chloroflexota bacterium]